MLKLVRRLATAALAVLTFERFLDWMFRMQDMRAVEDLEWTVEDEAAANDAYWNPR